MPVFASITMSSQYFMGVNMHKKLFHQCFLIHVIFFLTSIIFFAELSFAQQNPYQQFLGDFSLQQKKSPLLSAPNQRFYYRIDADWTIGIKKNTRNVFLFISKNPAISSQVQIYAEVVPVTIDTTLSHIMLLSEEKQRQELPNYSLLSKEQVFVHGLKALELTYEYDYLGNVQFGKTGRDLFLIYENFGYIVRIETVKGVFPQYVKVWEDFVGNFFPTELYHHIQETENRSSKQKKIKQKTQNFGDIY